MNDGPAGPPEEFLDLVRDALLHLHDLAYLQTQPLLSAVADPGASAVARGRLLYQALLDAIEQTRPAPGTPATSRAWRAYRILELRYIDGHEVGAVLDRIALSKNQYHRDHNRALQAVGSILWDRWRLESRWPDLAAPEAARQPDARDLARIEAGKLAPDSAAADAGRIDPREVVLSVVELLRPLCLRRGVDLLVDAPERLPPVRGERVALRQALLTIIAHAINESGAGTVSVEALGQPGRVVVRVAGEAPAPLEPSRLGVEASRPFVESLAGQVQCASPDGASGPGRWEVLLSFPANDRSTLLVVDNNADFIRLVERYLVDQGWTVVGAPDVDRAYALAQQERLSAVLLDVVIPGRDGWELLLALKSNPATRDVPVIVCSVLDEPEVAISLGAASYLQKPIDKRRLVEALGPYR